MTLSYRGHIYVHSKRRYWTELVSGQGAEIIGGGVRPTFWLYRSPGRTEIMMEPFFRRERPSREKAVNVAP